MYNAKGSLKKKGEHKLLSYYQKAVLAYLVKFSYLTVTEIKKNHGICLLNRWENIKRDIGEVFEIHDFNNSWRNFSFGDIQCIKSEHPGTVKGEEKFCVIRELIEFVKISARKIKESGNPYDTSNALYFLINKTLPQQFDFNYYIYKKKYEYDINIRNHLITKGMKEVEIDCDMVWVFPSNYNKREGIALTSLYLEEAEGLLYIGGIKLLDHKINYSCLSFAEIQKYHEQLNRT
jgi:hypothetical protein